MTISDINTEEACQIAVAQGMKHMRPDNKPEILNVENTFPQAAREAPNPAIVSVAASRIEAGLGSVVEELSEPVQLKKRGLSTTINNPEAIERDKLNYLYTYQNQADSHVPGVCPCADCVRQQVPVEALMEWALAAAQQQHAQAIADATAAAEQAQRTGEGPKPMMVTPYKHNWVISGKHPEHDDPENERWIDVEGIVSDIQSLWEQRKPSGQNCCTISNRMDTCRMM